MKYNNIGRRKFIVNSLLATGGVILSTNFISCSDDDDFTGDDNLPDDLSTSNFDYGVASFDPTASQVIIWTRYTTQAPEASIIWQIAADENFETVIRSGEVTTTAERDYTLAVEIQDLDEDQKLFYRFINSVDATVSPTGETITLPENADTIKLAVCSCSNFPAGYFNVYRDMANSDADIVVHLGDYIYEYEAGGYGTIDGLDRVHEPADEIIELDEYRQRYKQYRSDKDLMLAHQKKPFICVWDDHEITNDAYKDGAQNHQEDEGSFEVRKQVALQAYSEYLPVRSQDISLIYRSITVGNLVNLIMLDTRIVGRDKQLDYTNYFASDGSFDQDGFQTDWLDPNRTILGATQRDWLIGEVNSNTAQWQVLGQQVLMGKMMLPAELLTSLTQILAEVEALGSATPETMMQFQQQLAALVEIKLRLQNNDPTLTTEEIARVTTVLPYNLDAWDGYPAERELLYQAFAEKKVVCLAGDTHNAWASKLTAQTNSEVGMEFATASVTSPGLEAYLGSDATTVAGFEQAIQILIDDLNYINASQRGYLLMTFTQADVNGEWVYVDTVTSASYSASIGKTVSYS